MLNNFNKTMTAPPGYRLLPILFMIYTTFMVAPAVLAYKLVPMGPFLLCGSTIVFPITYIIGDVVAEVYGYAVSRQMIWMALACNMLFVILVTTVINLPSPKYWDLTSHYHVIFHDMRRLAVVGILSIVIGAFLNAYLITKWKIMFKGRFFWFRSICSTSLGEIIQGIIAVVNIFFGHVAGHEVIRIAVSSYVLKLSYTLLFVWPASWIVRYLKKKEEIDVYDNAIKFNPFKLSLDDPSDGKLSNS